MTEFDGVPLSDLLWEVFKWKKVADGADPLEEMRADNYNDFDKSLPDRERYLKRKKILLDRLEKKWQNHAEREKKKRR